MKKEKKGTQPNFPFDKMPYQEKEESGEELEDFYMDSEQELDIGESDLRKRKRTLRDEKGAGHEP